MSTIASSTVIESCISSEASPPSNIDQLLEITLISAEDLAPISKSMQTYAVTWINPNRKRTTQTDQSGHKNPEWSNKFIFRLDNDNSEDATTLTVEIYTISSFRDVLLGSVRVRINDLIAPLLQTAPDCTKQRMRFVTLQVRRPSGSPQGILKMGVGLLDGSMTWDYSDKNSQQQKHEHYDDDNNKLNEKIHLWRSMSTGSHLNNDYFTSKPGSMYNDCSIVNGSTCDNGSELCSDIGPSPSMLAEELAMKRLPPTGRSAEADDAASSILEVMTIEEAKARGYRVASKGRCLKPESEYDGDGSDLSISSRRSRRRSDGGLFSCYGVEFNIVCGASKNPSSNRKNGSRRRGRKPSEVGSAQLI